MKQDELTKICMNCEHYRVTKFTHREVCIVPAKWQSTNFLVTGKLPLAIAARSARSANAKCGENATHFETKVTVP